MKTTATQIRWAKRPLWHRGKVGIGVIDLQPMHSPGPTVKPDSGFMLFHDPLDILGVSKAKKAGALCGAKAAVIFDMPSEPAAMRIAGMPNG